MPQLPTKVITQLFSILSPLWLILLWQILWQLSPVKDLLASPKQVWEFFVTSDIRLLLLHSQSTLFKVIFSFGFALILAFLSSSIIFTQKFLHSQTSFVIDFFRTLPPTAIFPLFMLFFGIGDWSKIWVCSFGLYWIMLFGFLQMFKTIDTQKIRNLQLLGANTWQVFRHFLVFVLLSETLTLSRIGFNLAFLITITLEMFIGSETGLGKMILDARQYYEIPAMFGWLILSGVIGYMVNFGLGLVGKENLS